MMHTVKNYSHVYDHTPSSESFELEQIKSLLTWSVVRFRMTSVVLSNIPSFTYADHTSLAEELIALSVAHSYKVPNNWMIQKHRGSEKQ